MDLLRKARRIATALAVIGAMLSEPVLSLGRAATVPNEYSLKAVFLYNFCRFIDWPGAAFTSAGDPLVIGILGADPFGALLEEAVQGETSHGRSIRIEHFRSIREIRRCHVLFLGAGESGRLHEILAAVAGTSIVTVGETTDFVDQGGMIALTTDQNRVRLVINPNTLRNANLNVSSKLLRVAEIKS